MKIKLVALFLPFIVVIIAWFFVRDHEALEKVETISSRHETKNNQDKSTINVIYNTLENNGKEAIAGLSGIELRKCKNIPKTKDALDTFLDLAIENGEPFQYFEDVLHRFERCKQYSHIDQNYIQILIVDADKGSIDSLNEIWKIPEAEYFEVMGINSASREDIILKRLELAKVKYRLAQKLAISGNDEAVLKLVKSYQSYDPISQSPNYVKSLAYANFGLQMTQDNDYYLKLDWFKQSILKNSSPEEIESANSITEQLLKKAEGGGN